MLLRLKDPSFQLILGSFSSDYTGTRFDRVRGSRTRFRSNIAFIAVNKQREKKFLYTKSHAG